MPFCSQCGKPVGQKDVFCHACGAKQPEDAPGPSRPIAQDPLAGITPRTASILCYIPVVGWIAAIVVLAAQKYRHVRAVRFHAFQALYLFVAWLMNDNVLRWVFTPIAHLHFQDLIRVVLLGMSIFMMVKASHDEEYSLPLFGELAHRSVSES
ncbi:MAG TPA: zinc-ribbon domain-containing protein [Bryobacteraceae bacterium]|nr:zinc-ribbon domain-containing protein [Bryobacteraceae bacterium]